MKNLTTYQHYTLPMYDYQAKDKDILIPGSSMWLSCDEIIDVVINDSSPFMEILYLPTSNTREINIIMISFNGQVPDGYQFLKSITQYTIVYYIFVKIYKTPEEEMSIHREERFKKLLDE